MKLKKIQHITKGDVYTVMEQSGQWVMIENYKGELLQLLAKSEQAITHQYNLIAYNQSNYKDIIPFQPTAYRDFMLYEKHAIDAARGFVKKYMSGVYPIVKAYETILGKPFPKLKPKKRYYKHPIYYMGNHLNMISHHDSIAIPSYSTELDYELELAAVIIKPLKNATIEEVNDAIGGFLILNDFSARDVQLEEIQSGFGPMKTKNFGNSISSVVVGKDSILDKVDNLNVKVIINGETIVTSNSKDKLYSFQEAIAYASWEEQLHPGELFGSGTIPKCTGIENGLMLNKGDTITLEVDELGTLTNKII